MTAHRAKRKNLQMAASGAKASVGHSLAERIAAAPRLTDPSSAQARVAEWLAQLADTGAEPLTALLAANPIVNTLIESLGESSPYLWELASREPARLLRLLRSDPDEHLAALLAGTADAITETADEAETMRLLRHMKAEAALLIALADIGGVWPVMRATRALTELADTAVAAAVQFLLGDLVRSGRLVPRDKARPQDGSGYIVLAMGKMGAFELNYSSDIDLIVFFDPAIHVVPQDVEDGAVFHSAHPEAGETAAGAHRRRLRFPHRSAPAPRSILDGDRDLHRRGLVLLREQGTELGACGDDQGAALRRRH